MSMARIVRNVYIIGGRLIDRTDTNAYLIYNEPKDYYLLIDSTTGKNIDYLLDSLLEIMRGENKLKYVILTSCKIENSGGLNAIYEVFKPITIAHVPDSGMIRTGECENKRYLPTPISLEIKDYTYSLDDIIIILNKTVSKGSVLIRYKNIIFSGSNTKISPLPPNIKYICDINECRMGN